MARLFKLSLEAATVPEEEFEQWVGFDLDGTVAANGEWKGVDHIGEPIPNAINLIKDHIAKRIKCKIFTARVGHSDENKNEQARKVIEEYCLKHIGQILEITNKKDPGMILLFDDRARQVIANTGEVVVPH
jgi:hypothetical protein